MLYVALVRRKEYAFLEAQGPRRRSQSIYTIESCALAVSRGYCPRQATAVIISKAQTTKRSELYNNAFVNNNIDLFARTPLDLE